MVSLPLVLFVVALCLREVMAEKDGLEELWVAYKNMYNKTYNSTEDEAEAKGYFQEDAVDAMLHNMDDGSNYTQTIYEYSDKSTEEAIEILCGIDVPPEEELQNRTRRNFLVSGRLSQSEKDWRKDGAVSPVKQQGSCGSCWTYSAAQAVEGQAAVRWKSMWEVSKQQLLDCSSGSRYGNNGCNGGWPDSAFQYMINEGGVVMESCYPYTGKQGTCNINKSCYRFKVKDYVNVVANEDAVAEALAKVGPMSIALYVNDDFMRYQRGIFSHNDCNKKVNHGMLLVGYGSEGGNDYWIIKNSWGTSWGENGYMRIARNRGNMCKVVSYASYPVLA